MPVKSRDISMRKKKRIIYIFFGTTAELIKLIPVIKELERRKVTYRIVLSGQTDIKFDDFDKLIGKQKIYFSFRSKMRKPSALNFFLWAIKTTFAGFFWARKEFSDEKRKKIIFVVHSDTVSTLVGALISFFGRVKLAHVEAGLRSYNFLEPFPEEICRTLTSYFADIHFCPNKEACKNIKDRKGVKINTKWNTSVEALSFALKRKITSPLLRFLKKKPYFIFILHRQEHLFIRKGDSRRIIEMVVKEANKNLLCLFIVHKVTKQYLSSMGLWEDIRKNKNIKVISGLPFLEFVRILKGSEFIVSDGGGNQTESHFFGKPCLIMRRETEQTEGIGKNAVLSREDPKIINNFFKNYKKLRGSQGKVLVWPSKIIVDGLLKF